MNIIINLPDASKLEELNSRVAEWHWDCIKSRIELMDSSIDNKKAIYDTIKELATK